MHSCCTDSVARPFIRIQGPTKTSLLVHCGVVDRVGYSSRLPCARSASLLAMPARVYLRWNFPWLLLVYLTVRRRGSILNLRASVLLRDP